MAVVKRLNLATKDEVASLKAKIRAFVEGGAAALMLIWLGREGEGRG